MSKRDLLGLKEALFPGLKVAKVVKTVLKPWVNPEEKVPFYPCFSL